MNYFILISNLALSLWGFQSRADDSKFLADVKVIEATVLKSVNPHNRLEWVFLPGGLSFADDGFRAYVDHCLFYSQVSFDLSAGQKLTLKFNNGSFGSRPYSTWYTNGYLTMTCVSAVDGNHYQTVGDLKRLTDGILKIDLAN